MLKRRKESATRRFKLLTRKKGETFGAALEDLLFRSGKPKLKRSKRNALVKKILSKPRVSKLKRARFYKRHP